MPSTPGEEPINPKDPNGPPEAPPGGSSGLLRIPPEGPKRPLGDPPGPLPDEAPDTPLLPKPSIGGRGSPTPEGFPDPRREQPRRDSRGRPEPLPRPHLEPPPGAGPGVGKSPSPPASRERLRNRHRVVARAALPQLGVMNPWNVQHPAPSGPPLGGTDPQVLQPLIVHSHILLHPQARPQRRLGKLLGRVLKPVGGQGGRAAPAGQTSAVGRFQGDSSPPGPIVAPPILSSQGIFDRAPGSHPSSSNSIILRGFRRSISLSEPEPVFHSGTRVPGPGTWDLAPVSAH